MRRPSPIPSLTSAPPADWEDGETFFNAYAPELDHCEITFDPPPPARLMAKAPVNRVRVSRAGRCVDCAEAVPMLIAQLRCPRCYKRAQRARTTRAA